MNEKDAVFIFDDEPLCDENLKEKKQEPWTIMIVDDDEAVHKTTTRVLEDFSFDGRGVRFLHAYSGEEAKHLVRESPETAVILIDAIMETDHAGLELVQHIRDELRNHVIQIIIRTGQPDQLPEHKVSAEYNINDYKSKAELTFEKLYTVITTSLRAYSLAENLRKEIAERKRAERKLFELNEKLDQCVRERTAQLSEANKHLEAANRDMKIAKEAAEAANRTKTEFLSNMSHELRTPLNGILGFARILGENRELSSLQTQGLDIIKRSGEHLLTLINDILDLSKVDAGKMEIIPTDFHLQSFLDMIEGIIRIKAEQGNILFRTELREPLPSGLCADKIKLRQVLINLLGNAVKFTREGSVTLRVSMIGDKQAQNDPSQGTKGRIHNLGEPLEIPPLRGARGVFSKDMSVCQNTGNTPLAPLKGGIPQLINAPDTKLIRFEVIDTGTGMTPYQLEKIFLPFEQVGNCPERSGGVGLGLAISQRIVRLMNSELKVISDYGKGSTFWFDLEVKTVEAEEPEPRSETGRIVGYKGKQLKVLVADDFQIQCLLLADVLEPLGFKVETAEDGLELVSIAETQKPDVILADLIMPVMTGLEALRKIRMIPELKKVPFIIVSASVYEETKQKCREAGCDDFLDKPVNVDKLLDLLGAHLKLEWKYEKAQARGETEEQEVSVTAPCASEMEKLYHLAMSGDMNGIQKYADYIEQLDSKYSIFACKLRELAKACKDDELEMLIEQYAEK
ncbi:MAG: response regulator [Desulfobacterales bacterium]|nr:response regulator [Desulfobacterales bacterium]